MRKYHLRLCGGRRLGRLLLRSRQLEGGEERLHAGVGGMGMQFGEVCRRIRCRLEPDPLMPHRAQRGDKRL